MESIDPRLGQGGAKIEGAGSSRSSVSSMTAQSAPVSRPPASAKLRAAEKSSCRELVHDQLIAARSPARSLACRR